MIKLIILDDHRLFRMTMRMAFSGRPDIYVAGEADSGESLFTLLPSTPCDLVLLDILLPGMDGVAIARRLRSDYPSVKILAISSENTGDTVRALLDVGIDGYISKQTGRFDEIINAIHTVMDGETYYGSDIASIIYRIYLSKKKTEAALPELTTREKEIITWCSEGLIAKEIADRLGISVKTVHNHKNNIFAKLGIGNTMEMVKYAMKHNIIG